MADDLMSSPDPPDALVVTGDVRQPEPWHALLGGRLAAGVVSSPPYLNNFDYADATRLELYFWGVARTWLEMTQTVRSGMLIATTQQSRVAYAAAGSRLLHATVPQAWKEIQMLVADIKAERAGRPRGKEYDLLVVSYFADMLRLLTNMAPHLKPDAPVLLVLGDSAPYGVYVDTPRIVGSIASELGYDDSGTVDLRRRGLRWHSNGTRHSVALRESLLVLRSPGGN